MASIAKKGPRATLHGLLRRLRGSLRNIGIAGTLARAIQPGALPPVDPNLIHPFDRLHGTDTSGLILGRDLVFDTAFGVYTGVYLAISPSTLQHALTDLNIHHQEFTFVDVGCGKGRALLVAARFPFARCLGIELSPELAAIARANLATQPKAAHLTTILNEDATTFTFPRTKLLLFLYDTFREDTATRFLNNLESQLRAFPRETYILYAANSQRATLARHPFLELIYDIQIPLSPEDAAIDQRSYDIQFPPSPHDPGSSLYRVTHEHYTLYRVVL